MQVIDNPMIDSAESRGKLVQAGSAKLAMRFTDPPGEAIVIDGEHVWVYTPSTVPGQVIRTPVPSGGPVYGYNILAWLLDRPAERYKVKYLRKANARRQGHGRRRAGAGGARHAVRAGGGLARPGGRPAPPAGDPRASGATRTLTLSKLRVNQPVTDKTFKFEVPAGVRVVDQ